MLSKGGGISTIPLENRREPALVSWERDWVSDSQETAWENGVLVSSWLILEPEHAPELESFTLRVLSRVWLLAVLDISCCMKLNSMTGSKKKKYEGEFRARQSEFKRLRDMAGTVRLP